MTTQRQYGLWSSPITPQRLAGGLRISDTQWDSDGASLVWLEGRSDRNVLVTGRLDGNAPRDLTSDLSVRARVGYGGGDFGVGGGYVFFVANQQIYRQSLVGGTASPITPAFADCASPTVSPDGRWVMYVFSHNHQDGIALVNADGSQWPQKIATGHDFYMQPRWHPFTRHVAWIAWDHPNMPWDGTKLYLADVEVSKATGPVLKNVRAIAGDQNISIFQPEFSPDGKYVTYMSDENGWYNLYLYNLEDGTTRQLTLESQAQIGKPAWAQGQRTYGWSYDCGHIYYTRNEHGFFSLWSLNLQSGDSEELLGLEGYTAIDQPIPNPVRPILAAICSSSSQPTRLVTLDLQREVSTVHKRTSDETISSLIMIAPRPVTWRTADGSEVHGLFYEPRSERWSSSGKPPLLVKIHGGPTGQTVASFNSETQYFATRGYSVLEVNYRGSTGYGRKYMEALRGTWGVYDVEDAVSGAQWLIDEGLVDPEKVVIMGGSAGGYTVLQALVTNPGFFKAAICCYGVANAFNLAMDTHKFEERYLDSLLGPLPEASQIYRDRSPIYHIEKLRDPIAIFQGSEDTVVPPNQSEMIVDSLRQRGITHEYHLYQGEGHGWRKSETIDHYYRAIEAFLTRHILFN
jgi:dipeptidyl aminopeptidase/acylaminoacyl peptidase